MCALALDETIEASILPPGMAEEAATACVAPVELIERACEIAVTNEFREGWLLDAECRGVDPALFYPDRGSSTREAKEVCRECPVKAECLASALINAEKHGIWGGLAERQRRRLRRVLTRRDLLKVTSERSESLEAELASMIKARTAPRRWEGPRKPTPPPPIRRAAVAHPEVRRSEPAEPEAAVLPIAPVPMFRPAPLQARPHQLEAIAAGYAALADGGRAQIVMACGTGKTLVGQRVAEATAQDGCILVCVPSLSLVDQIWRSWAQNATKPFTSLAVCSDDDLTDDDVVDGVARIVAETGMTVTTEPSDIARFLETPAASGSRVVFSTYHSSPRIAEAYVVGGSRGSEPLPPIDLVVCDEAHRVAGRLDSPFATVLDDAEIPADRRLFLTATPRRSVRRDAMASMDDEDLFGPVAYRLGFGDAIDRDLLSDYQIVVVEVNSDAALDLLRRGTRIELPGGKDADPAHVAVGAALAEAAREYDLRSILAFHDRVASSKRFDETLSAITSELKPNRRPEARLVAKHMDGKMPGHRRRELLDALDDPSGQTWHVLSSVRTIAEGVDVPAIDCVVFVDPRQSAVDIVQAVGRALRKNPNREAPSVILVPVYMSASGEDAVDFEDFEQLWNVVDAMRKEDGRLEAAYERLGVPARPKPHGDRPPREHPAPEEGRIVLPQRLVPQFLAAIQPRLITRRLRIFGRGLEALDAFIESEGHADVPIAYVDPSGFTLGKWVAMRRHEYKTSQLAPDQVLELETRGLIWGGFDAKFRTGIRAFRAWRQANPEAELDQKAVAPDGFAVGKWVANWCNRYSRGEAPDDRIRALRAHGVPVDLYSPEFWPGLGELDSYLAAGGSKRITPYATTTSGFHVGLWYSRQFERYMRAELSASEFEAIEARGVIFVAPEDDDWDKGLSALRAWRAGNEGAQRPNRWLLRRCYDRRRGRLTEEQRLALAELGIAWAGAPISMEQAA